MALWILYNGIRRGALIEFFKLLGVGVASILCLHYFGRLAQVFYKTVAIPRDANDVLAFLVIWLATTTAFKLIRDGILLLRGKKEEKGSKVSWAGLCLAALRAVLVCGLVSVAFWLTGISTLRRVTNDSLSAPVVRGVVIGIYQGTYQNVVAPLFPDEELNPRIEILKDSFLNSAEKLRE
jgi:hypothetical protein